MLVLCENGLQMTAKLIKRIVPTLPLAEGDDSEPVPKESTKASKSVKCSKPEPTEFDRLVESAFEFLSRGLKEVKKEPKYSIIDFFTGIELLLKARLLHEHWSLMVARPGETSREKFLAGDFESATRKQCFERLEKVCGEALAQEKRCFDNLAENRNRAVHFYHKAYSGEPDQSLLEEIVIQQLRAGAYLVGLLRNTWKSQFSSHGSEIKGLDRALRDHKQYLNAKFDVVRPQLKKFEDDGGVVWICSLCGLAAAKVKDYEAPLKISHCLVCDYSRSHIHIDCPECEDGEVEFDVGEGSCNDCDKSLDLKFLLSEFAPDGALAFCPECEYLDEHSVIKHGNAYLCLACGTGYNEVGTCEFCNEDVAGDLEYSYADGCMFCDGKIGWEGDS
jgi:hypothetical protein